MAINAAYESMEKEIAATVERLVEHIASNRLEGMVRREIDRLIQEGAARVGQDVIIGLLRKGLQSGALDAKTETLPLERR